MRKRTTRRQFLKTTAAASAGYFVAAGVSPKRSLAASEEIRFACIGIGGKGSSDSADAGLNGKVVAMCDIDEERLGAAGSKFNGAKKYFDYRKMLEENDKNIDAVTVSTPDHTHACSSIMAMRMGKACYTQKPLTHSLYEARLMAQVAKETKVATQMGNQHTAHPNLRESAALIQAGAIGAAKHVHIWTNRPKWPQGLDAPAGAPVPTHVHWNEWIGPAKFRDYNPIYHPFKWRGWWDFGTGALGDMACHTLNMAFMALNLRNPTSVQATTSGHNKQTYPKWSRIEFEFPAMGDRPPVKMTWYDGGERIDPKLLGGRKMTSSGALVVGDKGSLYSPGDYGGESRDTGILVGGEFIQQRKVDLDVEFERSPGHFEEFAAAIKGGKPARSNFAEYGGPLTETVLLGNLAVWAAAEPGLGKKIEWDAENLTAKDADEETREIIKHTYNNGYSLES